MISVAANLKSIIEAKGYKQKKIAEKAGYTQQQFSDMLNGRRKISSDDILAICKVLSISPNAAFGFENISEQ